jgi:hypothetical protein
MTVEISYNSVPMIINIPGVTPLAENVVPTPVTLLVPFEIEIVPVSVNIMLVGLTLSIGLTLLLITTPPKVSPRNNPFSGTTIVPVSL